jgi:transcriptional regulator with XRE-family HTH domain
MAYMNLQAQMAQKRMMRKDLARLIGRDNAVATNLFKGERPLTSEEAKMLAQYFGVTTDVILDQGLLAPGNRLKEMREDRGFSAQQLAKKLNLPVADLHKIEKNGALAYALKQRASTLLECHPSDLDPEPAPRVTTRSPAHAQLNEPRALSDYLHNATSLELQGASLTPPLDGDFVLLLGPRYEGVAPELLNKLCLVELKGGVSSLRIVRRGRTRERYDLENVGTHADTLHNTRVTTSAFVKAMVQKP